MDWFSSLADWANQNEGLLQVVAMLGGAATLLVSLRKQRASLSAREPVPATLVVRPVPADRSRLLSLLGGFGGQATAEDDEVTATFADADEAARAALEVHAALDLGKGSETTVVIFERGRPRPDRADAASGAVRVTDVIRRALLDVDGLRVLRRGTGSAPYVLTAGTRGRGWRWAIPAIGIALLIAAVLSLIDRSDRPSASRPEIAVLPFVNQSGDTDQAYFSDGVTQDVIAALGRFSNLLVMSWDAVLPYRNEENALERVKTELGVRYVVRGAIRRSDERVRVAVQLSDAARGVLLWSERYDQKIDDIFKVQDEITEGVASQLAVRLTAVEQARASSRPTENLAAYEYALRARQLLKERTRSGNLEARSFLERAVALDPNYAAAYARLAETYHDDAADGWTEWPDRALERALALARKSVEIDGNLAHGHAILGRVHSVRGQHELALEQIDRAIDLNPNDPSSHAMRGTVLVYLSQPDEAIRSLENALRYDPNLEAGHFADLGTAYYLAGRLDDAQRTLEGSVAQNPDFAPGHIVLTAVYAEQGRLEEAKRSAEQVKRLSPFFEVEMFSNYGPFKDSAHRSRLAVALRNAGLE